MRLSSQLQVLLFCGSGMSLFKTLGPSGTSAKLPLKSDIVSWPTVACLVLDGIVLMVVSTC